ncbi:phosphotransferase [Gammaproteobacteria bacterium]|nr:phosphotransferase [Gammaproteobacteria bacterium]
MSSLSAAIAWCSNLDLLKSYDDICFEPIVGDAGFREYMRIRTPDINYILVYAPPESEKNQQFINLSIAWRLAHINTPLIHKYDLNQGFLFLSDLGSSRLYDHHNRDSSKIYLAAIDELLKIQQLGTQAASVPIYDKSLIAAEVELFINWFLIKHLNIPLTQAERAMFEQIIADLQDVFTNSKQVVVHRDFHSKNILLDKQDNIGLVDFQDAVIGPVSYDLVSLLKDCYVKLPTKDIERLLAYYISQAAVKNIIPLGDTELFIEEFHMVGLQRHLKAIGIFARLAIRDNKLRYLESIPLTLDYIVNNLAESAIYPDLLNFLQDKVIPAV